MAPEPVKPKPAPAKTEALQAASRGPRLPRRWSNRGDTFSAGCGGLGLRLGEALNLYWDRSDKLCVDLSGRRPMLRIVAELEKGGRDRLLPIAPEFADFLLQTPEAERHGRVFKPLGGEGERARRLAVSAEPSA